MDKNYIKSSNVADSKQVDETKRFGAASIPPEYDMAGLIDIYEVNTTAQKCIEIYSKSIIKAGFSISLKDGVEQKKILPSNLDLAENLFNKVNKRGESFLKTIKDVITDLMATGTAAIEVSRNNLTKLPNGFFRVPISSVRVLAKTDEYESGERFIQNELKEFSEEQAVYFNRYTSQLEFRKEEEGFDNELNEVIWLTLPNPKSRFYGQSPSITLLKKYLITKYCEDYNLGEFENGLLSKFFIIVKNGQITENSMQMVQDFANDITSVNPGIRIPIINAIGEKAEVEIQKVTEENKEGSYLDLMKFNREEVYVAFGVPPILLGITENSTLANQQAQERKFYEDEIVPLKDQLNNLFTDMIENDFGLKDYEFKFNNISFKDLEKESKIAGKGLTDGSFSINEKREAEGRDPLLDENGERLAGAEMHLVKTPHGLIPVKDLENLSLAALQEEKAADVMKKLYNFKEDLRKITKEEHLRAGINEETPDEY